LDGCSCRDRPVKVDGTCYYHLRIGAGLIRPEVPSLRSHASLTLEQERFVGIEAPATARRWDYTEAADLFSQLLQREPIAPWEGTTTPAHDNSSRRQT
jgi:hypothetical protein